MEEKEEENKLKKEPSENDGDEASATIPKTLSDDQLPSTSTGKRKLKDSGSPSKKKNPKDGRCSSMSIAGPSTSSSDRVEREKCPICKETLGSDAIGIPDCCNHSYCYECIHAWVIRAKSNCPMDRRDIKSLKVYEKGKLVRTEPVEPKVPEEEEIAPEDEGEICPDCGWIGVRPSLGVCLHCMFHHDHPWPVEDCPQCMEAESNASDDDWEPTTSRVRQRRVSASSDEGLPSSDNESLAVTSESEEEYDDGEEDWEPEDEEDEVTVARPAPAPARRVPVTRKIIKKRVVKKKKKTPAKKKTTTKRKTTVKRKTTTRRKTTTKRKRKTKKRSTTTTITRRRKTKKRVTRKKKKGTLKSRSVKSRRKFTPSDSAKARLAKLLGLKPPKNPGQTIPRGCKPQPVTYAQRIAAASSSSSGMVNHRPIGSLSYHHRALPTLHLFGGDELEYFPSDSDSGGEGGGGSVAIHHGRSGRTSEARVGRQLMRQKGIAAPSGSSYASPVDILGSILESQSNMRTPFDIRQDGSIMMHSSKNNSKHILTTTPRLDLKNSNNVVRQRPSSPSSADSKTSNQPPAADAVTPSSEQQLHQSYSNCDGNQEATTNNTSTSNNQSVDNEAAGMDVGIHSDMSTVSNNTKSESQDEDEEEDIDLYGDIPNSEIIPRDTEDTSPPSSPKPNQSATSPVVTEDNFDNSIASNDSEGEGEEGMIIDETEHAAQSPQSVPSKSPASEPPPAPPNVDEVPVCKEDADKTTSSYGNESPCYGGGSPKYTAADTVDAHHTQSDIYSGLPVPSYVCPSLFTYSAASIDIARNCGAEEDGGSPNEDDEEDEEEENESVAKSPCATPEPSQRPSESAPATTRESPESPVNQSQGQKLQSKKRKLINKETKRASLVEELFGSDLDDCEGSNNDKMLSPPVPSEQAPSAHVTGLEGLDTETISETEEEANFNDPEEGERNRQTSSPLPCDASVTKSTSSSKADIDYEEGEIVEDRPKVYKEPSDSFPNTEPAEVLADRSSLIVATSPVSPEANILADNCVPYDNVTPTSPMHEQEERPSSRSRPATSRRRSSKPRSPERKRGRDDRGKKNVKNSDIDKNSGNIEWKKLSKNTKERNYRDGKAKENVSYERSEKRESRSSREERRSKKRKEKRKDLERYDVRKIINERSRREAERKRRDKFGRDISREQSHSRSPSKSPRPLSHNQPRHHQRSPDAEGSRSRGRRYRNESWSSNHSKYSGSGSSRASSTRPSNRHHSNSSHHRRHHSRDETQAHRRSRGRSSRSQSRSRSRDLPRRSRRERSLSYNQTTPGLVTIVSAHDRLPASSHTLAPSHPETVIATSLANAAAAAAANTSGVKKKVDKRKDKGKKDGKKKKKEYHRHVLAPLAPAGGTTNSNPSNAANALSVPGTEKKKRKREKSPPASKEVFASGDNILVSVNFNKPTQTSQSTPAPSLPSLPKSKDNTLASILPSASNLQILSMQKQRNVKGSQQPRDSHTTRNPPKRLKRDVGNKTSSRLPSDRSPKRKTNETNRMGHPPDKSPAAPVPPNVIRKREDGTKRRKRIADIAAKRKPVAIIDLESSPFAERIPSPAEIITLSDGESSRRSSSSRSRSRSSRRSSVDSRRGGRRSNKEDQRPRKQRKPSSKADGKNLDRQITISTPSSNAAPTVALGPKTPPEPQIKFSINVKPQLRSITNPLQDEDDEGEIDAVNGGAVVSRDKSELEVNASGTTTTSAIPTLIVSSHAVTSAFRGPNTPPEPCLSQSNSSSTTAKQDGDTAKGNLHASQSPVDAKSPDAYDPFEPTKSPSDVSSSEQQAELSQANADSLPETREPVANKGNLTPRSISDNSVNSPRLLPQAPKSPTPDITADRSKTSTLEEERKEETVSKKTDNASSSSHQSEEQQSRSSPPNVSTSSVDNTDVIDTKPTSTTVILPQPLVAAQGLITTLPPGVANILCNPQHQGLFRPPMTIATVPFLLSTPSLLGLRVAQQTLLTSNQQQSQVISNSQQQQQPDTTTTTDVVDMDLESPYSPASSEGDDLFEPPDKPPSPAYPPRKEKQMPKSGLRAVSHQKRGGGGADKFDTLFSQSTPLKKEASSTSGNRNNAHPSRGAHGHRSTNKAHHKSTKAGATQKSRGKNSANNIAAADKNKTGKKEILIKMDEDQLKILDDLPSSAVEMQVKEKFLKKLNRQERVVEEVKLALKPHYAKKLINKDEYKEILRRSVPKICHNKNGEINPIRIRLLVGEYVKKFRYIKKKDSNKTRSKADKQR